MATPTTTTATMAFPFGWCAAERDEARTEMNAEDDLIVGAASAADRDHPFGFAAIYRAYQACRRGKRGTRKAQRFETRLLDNLVETVQSLQTHTWRPSRATRFVVTHPKPREILAAEYGDRVVHHLLVPWFERYYEPVFIHDSFANRKGKGTHAAVDRLQDFLRQYRPDRLGAGLPAIEQLAQVDDEARPRPRSQGRAMGKPIGPYFLQLDIANFFNSINRRVLFGLLRHRLERDVRRPATDPRHAPPDEASEMLWLARRLLTGNPALDAVYQGRPADLTRVPTHKQLANAPAETGLPIGNLSSQFFANVYLNELDQFVKHSLKAPHYVRYVDDFVLLHRDRAQLQAWREAITCFLSERLGLRLRDAGRLAPVGNGIDFLGYIIRPHYRLVRRRVVGHLRERLAEHGKAVLRRDGTLFLPAGRVESVQSTLASYSGHFSHAQAGSLLSVAFARHHWLNHILSPGNGEKHRLIRRDRPACVTSLASQWRYFRRRYPEHVLMMQVGNRWECQAPKGIDLPPAYCRQPSARLPATWSLPFESLAGLKRVLKRQGRRWCEVAENGHLKGGMKRRQLIAMWPVPTAAVRVGAALAANEAGAATVVAGAPKEVHLGGKPAAKGAAFGLADMNDKCNPGVS